MFYYVADPSLFDLLFIVNSSLIFLKKNVVNFANPKMEGVKTDLDKLHTTYRPFVDESNESEEDEAPPNFSTGKLSLKEKILVC